MSCPQCENVIERTDVPHVIRKCEGCKREMRIVEPGEHGEGIKIRAGDQFVLPDGWLKLAMNPLASTGHFTREGLDWFARQLFVQGIPSAEGFESALTELERQTDQIVNSFAPLKGLDVTKAEDVAAIHAIMVENQSGREFWAYMTGAALAAARGARDSGDHVRASWAIAIAERCRSMMIFKEALEEVVWMGHSAKRIIDLLKIWDAHKGNSAEEFWQKTFNANTYALSQVFAVPVVFLEDKAYVGGMKLDRSDGRFLDYLFAAESSREAVLIEIKTPTTPLLGREYRGIRPPSHDLSGSVVQILNYRNELSRNLSTLIAGTSRERVLQAVRPRCAIIVGNSGGELTDETARRSFELYRRGLSDVEIITYDELFRKIEILAELFSLRRRE